MNNSTPPLISDIARKPSPAAASHSLLNFQHSHGNRFVQKLLRSGLIQTKLTLSEPGDRHEQEADRVADQVMRVPAPTGSAGVTPAGIQTSCTACADGVESCSKCAEEPVVQRQPLASTISPVIQRSVNMCEMATDEEGMFGGVSESGKSIEEDRLQRQADSAVSPDSEPADAEESAIQRSSDGNAYRSSDIAHEIERTKGQGGALAASVQQEFSKKMGADFTGVRIHTDSDAIRLSGDLESQAFTYGNDIYFNAGRYSPETSEGKHLLAHELTHTIQQGAASRVVQRLTVSPNGSLVKKSCGGYVKRWDFELSSKAPADGYIVQQVDLYDDIKDCPNSASCLVDPTLTFWEAWWLEKGDTLQHVHAANGYTDRAFRDPADGQSGFHAAAGEIKFYLKSVTGDLGREGVLSSDPDSKWKPGDQGGVALSGWLPSTKTKPSWWSSAPTEGPKSRQAYSAWDCCPGRQRFNVIRAEP